MEHPDARLGDRLLAVLEGLVGVESDRGGTGEYAELRLPGLEPQENWRNGEPASTSEPCYVASVISEEALHTLREFMAERDWAQFHSPENLAKSVSIEAGELLECFQWNGDGDRGRVADELADVLTYAVLLADRLELDPEQIILEKLERTRVKYPVEKAKGRSTRYDQL